MTFKINEFQFENISAEQGINTECFKDVLRLINRHENNLLDDYLPHDPEGLIQLIDSLYPWFFVIFKNGKFLGFIYCHSWEGKQGQPHSCYLTAAASKKFYGKDTRKVLSLFCNYLYDAIGLIKVQVEVLKENLLCIKLLEDVRFKKEGFNKAGTMQNGKPKDLLLYGKINPQYLTNINHKKAGD